MTSNDNSPVLMATPPRNSQRWKKLLSLNSVTGTAGVFLSFCHSPCAALLSRTNLSVRTLCYCKSSFVLNNSWNWLDWLLDKQDEKGVARGVRGIYLQSRTPSILPA